MRKVIFKAYLDGKIVEGMEGVFHCWGLAEDAGLTYSVGIIEQDGGTVITTHPEWIRFTDDKVQVTKQLCNGETLIVKDCGKD